MNKTWKIILVVVGVLLVSAVIFVAGLFTGRMGWALSAFGPGRMMIWDSNRNPGFKNKDGFGKMGGDWNDDDWGRYGRNDGYQRGTGMMGGFQGQSGRQGGFQRGHGMMGGYPSSSASSAKPLTVDQAKQAVAGYLKGLNNADLELKEIMIFDQNAYARIVEKSSGIGAMELLVDPSSQSVYPEYGPNMMWNLKYGHMRGFGGMMGRNHGFASATPAAVSSQMTVTPEQALKAAQQYLDQNFAGSKAASEPDAFYGYYTIDIMKDGKPTGMLSVNGFNQQVFLHTWHGNFIEMSE